MQKKVTEFPFELARRITFTDVSAESDAVKQQLDIDLSKCDRYIH